MYNFNIASINRKRMEMFIDSADDCVGLMFYYVVSQWKLYQQPARSKQTKHMCAIKYAWVFVLRKQDDQLQSNTNALV